MISVPKRLLRASSLFCISLFAFINASNSPAFAQPETVSYPTTNLVTELKLQASGDRNGDLGTTSGDDISSVAAEAKLKFTAEFDENNLFYWEGRGVAMGGHSGFEDDSSGSVSTNGSFAEWRQSYFQFGNIGDVEAVNARVGRQRVAEPYGLWWNQDFDAVRANYDSTLFKGSLVGGENLFSYRTRASSPTSLSNQRDITRFLAEGSWQYYYQHFVEARAAFANNHQDQAVGDLNSDINRYNTPGRLYWGGVRATGKTAVYGNADANKLDYRIDLLGVTGNEEKPTFGATNVTAITGRHVQGWALDAAVDIPLPDSKPLIHLGYAYGSGEDSATGDDNAFRQTGLQGNFSRIGALSQSTNNYGTVLKPELSNIHVLSAGVTLPVLTASDAGVIYRYYRLADAATSMIGSGVVNTLDGVHEDLGQGVDVMFNMDLLKETTADISHVQKLSLRSSLGFFRSGDAYGTASGETAVRGLVELKVGF